MHCAVRGRAGLQDAWTHGLPPGRWPRAAGWRGGRKQDGRQQNIPPRPPRRVRAHAATTWWLWSWAQCCWPRLRRRRVPARRRPPPNTPRSLDTVTSRAEAPPLAAACHVRCWRWLLASGGRAGPAAGRGARSAASSPCKPASPRTVDADLDLVRGTHHDAAARGGASTLRAAGQQALASGLVCESHQAGSWQRAGTWGGVQVL